ncbi:MAG: XTP/dITP diphosphatase [Desulfovibrionaceae bacterium]
MPHPATAIVLATRNKGKIAELSAMLSGFGLTVLGLDAFPQVGEIEETGATFADNALLKARAVCRLTGLTAVADDSGLEVDALDGAPGVYSARYAGPDATDAANNAKLLHALAGTPDPARTARFRCVMAVCAPGGATLTTDGAWEGTIARAPKGQGGFGYDPVFVDAASGSHAAELSREEKNSRSHRGHALRRLLEAWPAFWAQAGVEPA